MSDYPMLPLHPLCLLFPPMDEETFAAFVHDIRENGLREPIATLDGYVLDGRNRQLACAELGIKPEYIEYEGTDPQAFVVSKNLLRRHLKESQRAMVAARLANWVKGENQHTVTSANMPTWKAARVMAVSERSVATARKIIHEAHPSVVAEVAQGRATVRKAQQVLSLPRDQQLRALIGGTKTVSKTVVRLHFNRDISQISWSDLIALRHRLAEDLAKVDAVLAERVVDDTTQLVSEVVPASKLAKIAGGNDGTD